MGTTDRRKLHVLMFEVGGGQASRLPTSQGDCIAICMKMCRALCVPYSLPSLPTGEMNSWQFNSNSWAAGLLARTMGGAPRFNFGAYQAPGYGNPVPNWAFGK